MPDPDLVKELETLLRAIGGYEDPRRAAAEWKQVYRLLQKADVPSGRIAGIVGMRDAGRLGELIAEFGAAAAAAKGDDSLADGGEAAATLRAPQPPAPETCRRALRAFRKRLALTRLDEESKLGRGPLTKGAGTSAAAIVPPTEWPDEVWQELVRQGKLKYIGHGFYELA